MTCVFVAGTDTDAGKTIAAAALLYRLAEGAVRTLAMKPVAAGAVATASGLRNSDALQLELAMNARNVSYAEVNPICLAAPIAPHIAAEQAGIKLSVAAPSTTSGATSARSVAHRRCRWLVSPAQRGGNPSGFCGRGGGQGGLGCGAETRLFKSCAAHCGSYSTKWCRVSWLDRQSTTSIRHELSTRKYRILKG